MLDGGDLRDHPSLRHAGEAGRREVERVEQRHDVVREVVDRVGGEGQSPCRRPAVRVRGLGPPDSTRRRVAWTAMWMGISMGFTLP